jgi:gliding motility-associated-like protein
MYVVTSTAEGCGQGLTDTVWVFVSPQPVAAFSNSQANLGTVVAFTDQSTPQAAITAWQWDFGNGDGSEVQNPQYTYAQEEGTYTVTLIVATAAGCTDTVSVDLEVKEFFTITDVLTPNNDGVNDYVWITSSSADVISATIFSRWGESVWVGTGKDLRFYGKTNAGAELSAGTYYYVIQVDMGDGVVNDYTGYITLIR